MATHELTELYRGDDGWWVVGCWCGWDYYSSSRQQRLALNAFSVHVNEMSESELIKP